MKKTLIASAVAAAALSTSAFAMDSKTAEELSAMLNSMPSFYGNIQLVHVTEDDSSKDPQTSHEFQDNGSTFGFTHKHAITEDLEGFLKAELHFNADDKEGADAGFRGLDEAYIGIKGDFGSIQVGSDDTVYEWANMMDSGEHAYIGIDGGIAAQKEGDNVQYASPTIMDSLVLGVTAPVDSDSAFGGALAARYTRDNFVVALAYGLGRDDGVNAGDTIGLAGSIAIDDLTLVAQYETRDDASGTKNGEDRWGLQAKYTMGANRFKLGYALSTLNDAADTETSFIEFQALHNLSSNMYCYIEYLTTTEEATGAADVDVDTLAIGATYAF